MVNIGQEINKVLRLRGVTASELARRINTTPQNVDSIKRRSTLDTELLAKIGQALEFDFFKLYKIKDTELSIVSEPPVKYGKSDLEYLKSTLELYKNLLEAYAEQTGHWKKEADHWRELYEMEHKSSV